jgi:hypothetical protein
MPPIQSGRVTRSYTQQIEADPDAVFPLLCPVREMEWLDGWADHVELVHSDSGVAEEGCVFRTRPPGRPETVWTITRHDPAARVVEFARVTDGLVATRLRIGVEAAAPAQSAVHIAYTLTPLGDEGRALVAEAFAKEAFDADMRWWEASMNHWLRTGQILRRASGH